MLLSSGFIMSFFPNMFFLANTLLSNLSIYLSQHSSLSIQPSSSQCSLLRQWWDKILPLHNCAFSSGSFFRLLPRRPLWLVVIFLERGDLSRFYFWPNWLVCGSWWFGYVCFISSFGSGLCMSHIFKIHYFCVDEFSALFGWWWHPKPQMGLSKQLFPSLVTYCQISFVP